MPTSSLAEHPDRQAASTFYRDYPLLSIPPNADDRWLIGQARGGTD
jgi:hypothetical protein